MSPSSLLFTSSPHVHGGDSIPRIMETVIWALLPATLLSVLVFGWPALLVIAITTLTAMVTEHLLLKIRERPSPLGDRSAALTGLLLALTLPPHSPWWICVVGAVFAVLLGKQVYGGLGFNMFNPALIARVFLLISFPVEMTTWPEPVGLFGDASLSLGNALALIFTGHLSPGEVMDAVSAATPLGQYRIEVSLGKTVQEALGGSYSFNYFNATGGLISGSLGETSALLLALGGIYLLKKRIITWHIPVSMLAGCLVPAAIFWMVDASRYPDPVFHLVTGGLVLGVFFMATDMVTSPVTPLGQIIFGAGCGLLTYIIRTWGGYPEGVSFAIVIMNTAVPLLDQYTRPVVYGKSKKNV
ncbi:MAG: RnfABCDGE type electron transport complex subunit D [Magnetococcales bacterium]|nr:RnfABCDGE type electron transport complex subunit D [Magnetococcales bacterium]MBF0152010.1 RnfABCDGE type electron transport complex subunit D [Magnetococcales bacterium]